MPPGPAHPLRRFHLAAEGFFRAGRSRARPQRPRPPHGAIRQPAGGSRRGVRWDTDAGITDRDVAALRWLGQQYAARSDVLRVLLGRLSPGSPQVEGSSASRPCAQILSRWEDRGPDRPRPPPRPPVGRAHRQGAAAGRPGRARLVLRHPPTRPRPRRRRRPPRPGAKHPRRWPLASASGSCAGRPARATSPTAPSSSPTTPTSRPARPVRRGRRPAAQAGRGRGRADPQGRRPAARGLDPAPAWPLDRTVYYAPPEVASYLTGQLQRIRPAIPSRSTRCLTCPARPTSLAPWMCPTCSHTPNQTFSLSPYSSTFIPPHSLSSLSPSIIFQF
jgi:hypothetical protein